MKIEKAVAYAMTNICVEKNTNPCKLTSHMEKSTLENKIRHVMNGRTSNPGIHTLHEFCCLTGYSLVDFFARKEFDDLE